MREYQILWTRRATADLLDLYDYINEASGYEDRAYSYVQSIKDFGNQIGIAPHRGQRRDDLWPNLRLMAFKRRVVLACVLDEPSELVQITNVFYGGRDIDALLTNEPPETE